LINWKTLYNYGLAKKGTQAAPCILKIYCILYFKIVFLHIYKCAWKLAFLKSSHNYTFEFVLNKINKHDLIYQKCSYAYTCEGISEKKDKYHLKVQNFSMYIISKLHIDNIYLSLNNRKAKISFYFIYVHHTLSIHTKWYLTSFSTDFFNYTNPLQNATGLIHLTWVFKLNRTVPIVLKMSPIIFSGTSKNLYLLLFTLPPIIPKLFCLTMHTNTTSY